MISENFYMYKAYYERFDGRNGKSIDLHSFSYHRN